jgi:hypothetical protein
MSWTWQTVIAMLLCLRIRAPRRRSSWCVQERGESSVRVEYETAMTRPEPPTAKNIPKTMIDTTPPPPAAAPANSHTDYTFTTSSTTLCLSLSSTFHHQTFPLNALWSIHTHSIESILTTCTPSLRLGHTPRLPSSSLFRRGFNSTSISILSCTRRFETQKLHLVYICVSFEH